MPCSTSGSNRVGRPCRMAAEGRGKLGPMWCDEPPGVVSNITADRDSPKPNRKVDNATQGMGHRVETQEPATEMAD